MNKKVFISYSWGNKEHQNWIINLGKRLMTDTVDVILDQWSLKDGHDIYSFMEEMVKSEDIFRVLIICNEKYKVKSDERKGGVGTETQIITPNIYSKEKQEKFIPIVRERNENGEAFLPTYLASRKYIDFSQEEDFEDSYEELLRNILEAPTIPKPKLGTTPPTYITEDKIDFLETNSKIRVIKNQIKKHQKINHKYVIDFTELFLEKLWGFTVDSPSHKLEDFGIKLNETLISYKPLREDFISLIDILSSFENDFAGDVIIDFFENAPLYSRPKDENQRSWSQSDFDSLKIIFQELLLYTIAISLKNKNYILISELLNSKYFVKEVYSRNEEPLNFSFLYDYHKNLENYTHQVYKKITGFGNYIITNISDQIDKGTIILADTLCYCVSYLNSKDMYDTWFPSTYCYRKEHSSIFFDRVSSKKHFEKIKCIFNVENENELKEKLLKNKENSTDRITYGGNGGYRNRIPFVYQLIDPDKISIYR